MSFVPALEELRKAKSNDVIEKLHKMFSNISLMRSEEVVAAYQTLEAVSEEQKLTEDPTIQRLKRAMIAQMTHIASCLGSMHEGARFTAVTGQQIGSKYYSS